MPETPQYRELRSLEAESLRSLATLSGGWFGTPWSCEEQRGGSRTLRVTHALLELRRNTWRGAADVDDAGIHRMTFKYAGRNENPFKCEGILLGMRFFQVPESPGDADTDPGRRETKTLESCEIAFGRSVFTCRRP